jgi:hypothetical protein
METEFDLVLSLGMLVGSADMSPAILFASLMC